MRRIVAGVFVAAFAVAGSTASAEPRQEPPPPTEPTPPVEPPPDPFVVEVGADDYVETFDDPESLDRLDWFVHNAANFHDRPDNWHGDHDGACGPPTSTRDVNFPDAGVGTHLSTDRGELAYWCAPGGDGTGHLMTSFNTAGYGQVDFAPERRFTDVAQVCWDQNQTNLGNRKWTQMVVVPEKTFQDNDRRLDYVVPRIQDGPGSAGIFLTDGVFLFEMVQGSTITYVGQEETGTDFLGDQTIDDKARRFTTCVTDLEDGTVKIELERLDAVETRVLGGSFPDGPARVIFQDDNYNPPKAESPALVPDPFSWHWDNIVVRAAASAPDSSPARSADEPGPAVVELAAAIRLLAILSSVM